MQIEEAPTYVPWYRRFASLNYFIEYQLSPEGLIGGLYHDPVDEADDPSFMQLALVSSIFTGPMLLWISGMLFFITPPTHYKTRAWSFLNAVIGVGILVFLLRADSLSLFTAAQTKFIMGKSSTDILEPDHYTAAGNTNITESLTKRHLVKTTPIYGAVANLAVRAVLGEPDGTIQYISKQEGGNDCIDYIPDLGLKCRTETNKECIIPLLIKMPAPYGYVEMQVKLPEPMECSLISTLTLHAAVLGKAQERI